MSAIRTAQLFGVRPDRTWRVAATKFLMENQHKKSISDDASLLQKLDPFIGNLLLQAVHIWGAFRNSSRSAARQA